MGGITWNHLTGLLVLPLLAACASIGPGTVQRDRFDYNAAVAYSWKEQTLLNMVKSRYMDMPVFLDIAQIVGSYTLQGTASAGYTANVGSTDRGPSSLGDFAALGASGSWSDRPTITYTPLTGARFNKNLMTPIPPSSVLFMMEADWPVDLVWRLTVQGVNGIDATGPTADRYDRLVTLLRQLQLKQDIGMRVEKIKSTEDDTLLFFKAAGPPDPQVEAMGKELRDILGLPEKRSEYRVIYGLQPMEGGEIAILTRSMLQILVLMGSAVEVPEPDLREGRAAPPLLTVTQSGRGSLRVKYSEKRPADAYAAVPYRKGWYRIDDRDLDSKRTFMLMMLLFTLTETGGREGLPLVTIPAG